MYKIFFKKSTVWWKDTVLYSKGIVPRELSVMKAVGKIARETDTHVIMSHVKNYNLTKGIMHPNKTPNFYFIPKVLITKIEK